MSRWFMFKTILIYEALAILGWNVMARTEADYEKWLFENIHAVVYITLSSTMLFVTMVYVVKWSLDKLGLKRKMAELQDPRKTDEDKKNYQVDKPHSIAPRTCVFSCNNWGNFVNINICIMKDLWVEKYRPKTLKEYVVRDEAQRQQIQSWINDKAIPHLLLSGAPGVGKTTLAKVLFAELEVSSYDILEINASRENSVDTVREKIITFVQIMPFGAYKYVLLDEADYMSPNGQAALRGVMEMYHTSARFILTCNYPSVLNVPYAIHDIPELVLSSVTLHHRCLYHIYIGLVQDIC